MRKVCRRRPPRTGSPSGGCPRSGGCGRSCSGERTGKRGARFPVTHLAGLAAERALVGGGAVRVLVLGAAVFVGRTGAGLRLLAFECFAELALDVVLRAFGGRGGLGHGTTLSPR